MKKTIFKQIFSLLYGLLLMIGLGYLIYANIDKKIGDVKFADMLVIIYIAYLINEYSKDEKKKQEKNISHE